MLEMCRAAVEKGIPEVGFTEHFDLIPQDPCYEFFKADDWWRELEACRRSFEGSLSIRAGIELGEPHRFPNEMRSLLEAYPWDYSLGSMHWVKDWLVFDREFFERPDADPYTDYFDELLIMVEQADFDIVAHMDVVKRYGSVYFGPLHPPDYEDQIRRILRRCAERGLALEINTSTTRRSVREPSPSGLILKWYAQEGGNWVTLGSDAHHPDIVGDGLEAALATVYAAGFERLARFEARNPVPLEPGVE